MKNLLIRFRHCRQIESFFQKSRRFLTAGQISSVLVIGTLGAIAYAQSSPGAGELIRCEAVSSKTEARCTFMVSGASPVDNVSVSLEQRPVKSSFVAYPSAGESSALLMLVDVSDAKRKKAVAGAAALIGRVLEEKRPHQRIAIAQFDGSLQLLADFNVDAAAQKAALKGMGPKGQATELYKSSLEAIAILKKSGATRRALVIFSDGKAEDTGYGHDDVIREARAAEVMIFTVGYPEAPSETPSLQTLERLSKDSGGQHRVAATADKSVPNDTTDQILGFAEHGGVVTFAHDSRIGRQSVVLSIKLSDGELVSLTSAMDIPDNRGRQQKIIDHLKAFAAFYAGAVGLLFAVLGGLLWLRKRRRARSPKVPIYAVLEELSGQGIKHRLRKQASRLGRAVDNDVCLQNNSVSSYHAEINVRRDGSLVLIDLGSSNGTYVNGKKIGSETIGFGALIELGEVRLRVQRPD